MADLDTKVEIKEKEEDANIDTFQECLECSQKPTLCPGCLSNRSVISFLNRTIGLQESTIKRLREINKVRIIDENENITIEELLIKLGNNFRGLWKSYYLDDNDEPNINKWTVTFIYKNHYVETPDFSTGKEALLWAFNKISNL